jgi:hypothetical protein
MAHRQLSRSVVVAASSIGLIGILASITTAASDHPDGARRANPNQTVLSAQKAGQPARTGRLAASEYCGGGEDTVSLCDPGPPCDAPNSAVITNGTVKLGVCKLGELNVPNAGTPSSGTGTTSVGLRLNATNADGLSPGCLCEGWGAGDAISHVSGSSNQESGTSGLTPVSFTHTATTAVSIVRVGAKLEVKQDYHPSATPNLYEDAVTITNISAGPVNPVYRRVMDWDVEPTAFHEYVTNQTTTPSYLKYSSDDGFANADPFAGPTKLSFAGDAVDNGPTDHGALYDFAFPALAAGASRTFHIYYGAADSEARALQAVAAVSGELYSIAEPGTILGRTLGRPNTFVFAFRGIGDCPDISARAAEEKQVVAQLTKQMTPRGVAASTAMAQLARGTGAYRMAFRAPRAGRAVVRWYLVTKALRRGSKARKVLFATGTGTFAHAGKATIGMRLTPRARRVLRSTRRVRLVARGTFAPAPSSMGATRSFALSR